MNKKAQAMSAIRHIFSAIGGVLIAYGVAGESVVMDVSGSTLALIAIIWSIIDKEELNYTALEGTLRQIITTVGTFVSFIEPNRAFQIAGAIVTILPIILGQVDKLKRLPDDSTEPATTEVA